jgi:spoIIIJ-associated protein
MEKNLKLIEETTNELLSLMGVEVGCDVGHDDENDSVVINLNSQSQTGLLIGNRGDTLNSLQAILGIIIKNKTGDWQRILVNVSDWREKQKDRLEELADQTAQRALETGEPQHLYNLSPADRRIVHMKLSKNKSVNTESQGEGKDRFLVITPNK